MYPPYPTSGQPAEPLRPAAPAPVRTAIRLMYAGAAISSIYLIILVAIAIADIGAAARGRWLGYSLTAARLSQLKPLIIAALVVGGLVVIALWLWLARANGQGRNWARIVSTVLFGLSTLQLTNDIRPPASHAAPGVAVLVLLGAVLIWLAGLATVWLLWRPVCSAFFKPPGFTPAGHSAQPS